MTEHDSASPSYAAAGVDITAGYRAVELMKKHVARTQTPGVAEGCVQSGAALIGGETAEMPGMYAPDEYDLAGFAVGLVDEKDVLDSSRVNAGDAIIGLASSGVHSNGFSLVRKVFDVENGGLERDVPELSGSLGEALLEPTRIYVKAVQALLGAVELKSVSHITGGGLYENLPRALPEGLGARIEKALVPHNVLFDVIARAGNIPERDMYNTFNMGMGMAVVVSPNEADKALAALAEAGEQAVVVGEVTAEAGVDLC